MQEFEQIILQHREIETILRKSFKELSDIRFALDESAIVAITDQKGKITFVNEKFCKISKYSKQELLGQDHRIINSGYHSKEFIRDLWRTVAQGKVWHGEIKNRAKDGTFYWVDTTIVPLLDQENKPHQYVAIRKEITKRKEMEETLKALPQRIIQVQEAEQKRISREIHDDLGQALVTSKILMQSLAEEIYLKNPDLKEKCEKLINYQDTIIEKAQDIASSLRPIVLQEYGLTAAIKIMIDEFKNKKGLKIEPQLCQIDNLKFQSEPINIYRIIQESLTNIIKHAKATKVDVTFKKNESSLSIIIKDNGRGFSVNKTERPRQSAGLGLSTMEERARLLGGNIRINTSVDKGTEVFLSIPYHEGDENHV